MRKAVSTVAPFPCTPGGWSELRAEDHLCRLMNEYEHSLLHFMRSLVQDADLAVDCVQDAFLRAYESLGRGRQVNQGWLFTVARNRAMDEFRRRRRLMPESEHPRTASFEGSSETTLTVQQALDRLPQQYREVLYLFITSGFKTDEIAELLGITGPAVRQRLYRARHEFRRVYGESLHVEEPERLSTRLSQLGTSR